MITIIIVVVKRLSLAMKGKRSVSVYGIYVVFLLILLGFPPEE